MCTPCFTDLVIHVASAQRAAESLPKAPALSRATLKLYFSLIQLQRSEKKRGKIKLKMYLQSAKVGLQWNHQPTIPEHPETPSTTPKSSWTHNKHIPGLTVIKPSGYHSEKQFLKRTVGWTLELLRRFHPTWKHKPAARGPETQDKVWTSLGYPL